MASESIAMTGNLNFDRWLIFRCIVVCCGLAPLVIWNVRTNSVWPNIWMAAYAQAAVLFGIALVGNYPPVRSLWFVKSMGLILLMHVVIQLAIAKLALFLASVDIRVPTRMFYGLVSAVVLAEGYLSFRIFDLFEPNRK